MPINSVPAQLRAPIDVEVPTLRFSFQAVVLFFRKHPGPFFVSGIAMRLRRWIVLASVAAVCGAWILLGEWMRRDELLRDRAYEHFCAVLQKAGFTSTTCRFLFSHESKKLLVTLDGEQIAAYLYAADLSKPIVDRLCTPSGIVLTREGHESECGDHPHQRGIFFAHGNVNGIDFWGNRGCRPQIRHIAFIEDVAEDPDPTIRVQIHWLTSQQIVLLEELRSMRFFAFDCGYGIDFAIRLTAYEYVQFEDTKEGLFAVRLANWLRETGGSGIYYAASGKKGAPAIWGTREHWVCMIGLRDDKVVGIAIQDLSAPATLPIYWHVRDYGLFSANPLGRSEFESVRNVPGSTRLDLKLRKGQSVSFAFRVLVFELEADSLMASPVDGANLKRFKHQGL